jgi:Tfp pilus assembly protein PilF
MRKLNLKLTVYLASGLVLFAVALVGVHWLQSGRIAKALLWQARHAQEQDQIDQVVRYLGRYLEFVPDDTDERANLGKALADPRVAWSAKGRQRALFVLEQVLTRAPDRDDVRRLLARLALDLQRNELAREHLEVLHRDFSDDGAVDLLYGQLEDASSHSSEAADWYRQAIAHAPAQIDGYVSLARLLRRPLENADPAPRHAEADRVMNDLTAQNAEDFRAHLARWQYRRQFTGPLAGQSLDEAARDVTRALELAPTEAETLLASAEVALTKNDPDTARTRLQTGLDRHVNDTRFYHAFSKVELAAGHRAEAAAVLRRGLQTVEAPQQSELLWRLANLLIDGGETEEVATVLADMRQRRFAPAALDYLDARLLAHKQQWAEAARLFERSRPLLEGTAELTQRLDFQLGQCYEQLGEPTQQLTAFRRVVAHDPLSIAGRVGVCTALTALGRTDDAIEQYRLLLKQPQAPESAATELSRLLMVRAQKGDADAWKEADALMSAALQSRPDALEAVLLRAEALAVREQFDQAEQLLQEARAKNPKKVEYRIALATLADVRKQPAEARKLLDEAERDLGDSVSLRLAQVRRVVPADSAKATLERLGRGLDRFPEGEQPRLLQGLAEANFRCGQPAEARRLWSSLAALPQHRNDLRLRLILFDLALQADDAEAMARLLDDVHRIEGNQGSMTPYLRAERLIAQGRRGDKSGLDEARTLLDAVAVQRPAWSAVLIARAEIEELKGNLEQAIANYRRALDLGDRSPRHVRQLVQLLYQRQRFDEADQEIRKLQAQAPLSTDLQRLAVDISLRNQDPARAITLAQQAVAADSRDYREQLWLGQVLAASGKRASEAEAPLRRAVALAPTMPEVWITLVQYLSATGRSADAKAVIATAAAQLSADNAPLALAQCHEAVGDVDNARQQYGVALTKRPDDVTVLRNAAAFAMRRGQWSEAEPLLRRVVSGNVKAVDVDTAWARRQLALVLAMGSDYRRYGEALNLVGLTLATDGTVSETAPAASDDDRRIRARVLSVRPQKPARLQAIALLEDLGQRQALTVDDRFLLARLYEADGAWPKARERFRDLLAEQGKNSVILAQYIRGLIRQDELTDAERGIDQLAQLERERNVERGKFGSLELRAQLLNASGKDDLAYEALKAHVTRTDARPEDVLQLAKFLGLRGRVDEALDLCEKAWRDCPPLIVGAASLGVVRDGKAQDSACARVDGWLRQALSKDQDNLALRLYLADLSDLRGRFADAEAGYRQVLERDERNVIALNNLAWLLAFHAEPPADALAMIERSIQVQGPRAELLDTRGVVQLALGKTEAAVADFVTATADAPTPTRLFHLARAHQRGNNREAALTALRRAQTAGLKPEQLHPLERQMYQVVVAALAQ